MDLILKMRDFFKAVGAGDLETAIPLGLAIATMLWQALSVRPMMQVGGAVASAPAPMKALYAAMEARSVNYIIDEMEACCNKEESAIKAGAPTGPLAVLLWPMLLALLKKLWGF